MPPEGPNKAEELLQRHAKERRERGGDFLLHPATRRLLQGEVTRQFGAGAKERSGWLAWFGLWRGRFAIGVAAAAVVIVGFLIFSNGSAPPATQQLAKADAPQTEKEFFLQPDSRLGEAKKEAAAPSPTDPAKLAAAARGISDDIAIRTKSLSRRTSGGETAASQDTKSPLQNVTLFADVSAAPAPTNTFNYTVALPPAQGPQGGQNPAESRSQLAFSAGLAANNSAPSQPTANQNVASGITQFGAAVANSSPAAEATDRYSKQPQTPGLATLGDEVQLAKQVNSIAPEQRTADATMRARVLNAPQVALSVAPPLQSVAPLAAAAPATAPVEEKLKRYNETAGVANSPQPTAAPAAARFYRVDSGALGGQVAQRTEVDALAIKAASAKSAGTVLSQFTVEQQGTTIRWLEADGSVYEGTVGAPVAMGGKFQADFATPAERDKDTLGREKLAELNAQNVNRGEALSFRVSGSNVTMRQMVTVNGRFTPATNVVPATAGTLSRLAAQPEPRRGGAVAAPSETPLTIEGTVRVGVSNEQRFRAVRAPR